MNRITHSRLLCVWLPNWPVQRVQAAEPKLASGPLILSTRDARRGLLVAAANLAARAGGIRPGMRLSEASALIESEIRQHDPHDDLDVLCSLAEQAQQFSPIVGLEQLEKKQWAGRSLLQPECLLLDVTGLAALFGGEAKLMAQISQWLSDQRYFGCMAIAGSLGAAWAMANYGTRRLPQAETPEPASVPACRCMSLPAGDLQTIDALPLPALRLAPQTLDSLRRLGLRRIGDLQQLPRVGMATRLGSALLDRWDQALGIKHEPIISLHASANWSLAQTLEVPTQDSQTIAELLRRLSRELTGRLSQQDQGALRVLCRLDLVQQPSLVMQLGLFRPSNDTQHLERLLVGQLEQQFQRTRIAPLWRLSMQATLTAPMLWRQTDLFNSGLAARRDEIARLVDTLSCRLGRQRVLSARVHRESQPELASSFQPMAGRRQVDGGQQQTIRKLSSRLARNRAEPSTLDPLRRPLQLFDPPRAIQVAGVWRPATSSAASASTQPGLAAAPAKIKWKNAWLAIAEACGPERLESGWWKGPSARRDYYRVVTHGGSWLWIYRDLKNSTWYLHGLFD